MTTRGQFWRLYIPLALIQFFLGVLSPLLVWNIWACLSWTLLIFVTLFIYSKVLQRLRNTDHTWRTALLLLVPILNLYPIYLLYFKKDGSHPPKSKNKKFTAAVTLVCFLTTTTLFPVPAKASPAVLLWEWPKFEWPKIEWPRIEWPKIQIPGTNIIVDIGEGLPGINRAMEELSKLADKIDIPGTGISIYPKKNVEENIVLNIKPLLGDLVNVLDPAKPFAQLARDIIGLGRPYIEQYIKPLIPPEFRNFLNDVLGVIRTLQGILDIPIIGGVIDMLWDMIVGPIDDVGIDLIEIFAEPYNPDLIPPGGVELPPGVAPSTPPPPPPPPPNRLPLGALDGIDSNGVVTGWAQDTDQPEIPIPVSLQVFDEIEAKYGLLSTTADLSRTDGKPGFTFVIPKHLRDGRRYELHAYGKDTSVNQWTLLDGSPKTFQLVIQKTTGELTSMENSVAKGWAVDPDVSGPYEVKFYVEKEVGPDREKAFVGSTMTSGPDSNFIFTLPDPESYRDGQFRWIYAYVVDVDGITGEKTETFLIPFRQFIFPKRYTVSFEKDPITVAQGGTVAQKILNVPNLGHTATVRIGDQVAASALSVPEDYQNKANLRSFEHSFKAPGSLLLGSHTVIYEGIRQSPFHENFTYTGSFTLRVVQDASLKITVQDPLQTERAAEIVISEIPSYLNFIGKEANVVVKEVTLNKGEGVWVALTNLSVQKRDENVVIRGMVPYEAGKIVSKKEEAVEVLLKLETKDAMSSEGLNAGRGVKAMKALTSDGDDPLLIAVCKDSPATALLDGPHHSDSGYLFYVRDFGCHEDLKVKVTGMSGGKPFDPLAEKLVAVNPWNYTPPPYTDWWGQENLYIYVYTVPMFEKYPDVREITIEVSDNHGNQSFGKVSWFIETYIVKVLPRAGMSALYPGEAMRIEWAYYTPGMRTQVLLDNRELRKFYLEAASKAKEGVIEELSLPSDIEPGEHMLAMLQWDADKQEWANGATTEFVVAAPAPSTLEPPPPPSQVSSPSEGTTKLPAEEASVQPQDCPGGFEWSGYFKRCVEAGREESSPFEGKPCNPSIPRYQQRGCSEE